MAIPFQIQIQHLLKLNGNIYSGNKIMSAIQIQHLLKLNWEFKSDELYRKSNSNTTLVKVKCTSRRNVI